MWNASFKLTLFGCVISICCEGFSSLDVVCDELNDMHGMFVCSSFLISVYMFIVSKALLISSATVIVCARGAIWLNPFATVLFSVCNAVTVGCCVLYPCCMGVFGMFNVMQGRRLFSSVFAITEKRDMDLYEVPLSVSLLGFRIGTMLVNFHV